MAPILLVSPCMDLKICLAGLPRLSEGVKGSGSETVMR